MPDIVISDDGENFFLDRMIRTPWLVTDVITLRIFVNDYTPLKDVDLSKVVEATYPGYLPVDLDNTLWSKPVSIGGVATSFYGSSPVEFFSTSGIITAYGYFMTAAIDSAQKLIAAQRFDAPQFITSAAPALVLPQLRLHSESEP